MKDINNAKAYFENSIKKDKEYIPAKVNLLVTDFILNLVNNNINNKSYKALSEQLYLDKQRVNDLLILHKIFSKKKIKRKEIDKGSFISKLNFEKYTDQKITKSESLNIEKYNKISSDDFLFISRPYERINLTGSGIMILKNYDKYNLIKLGKNRYIFRVIDKDYLSYIQSISNKINYSRIYDLNSKKFKLIENEKMIVVSNNTGKIIEIILF